MEIQSRPVTLIRNNKFLYIEENVENLEEGATNYSLFEVFNIKSPIDCITLSSIVIPASMKGYYAFEISEYNGISFKVKIIFINQSHRDFINLLRVAATNLYYVSENGLNDWIPIDSITFQLIYPNASSTNIIGNTVEEQTIESSSLTEESISLDCGDVELLSRKLQEMALLFQSKSDIPIDVLEGLFHSIFPRRITKMNIIEGVGILISAMDQRLKCRIIRNVFKKLISLVKDKNLKVMLLENRAVPDLLLNLILNLWTLIESLKVINVSCEKLKDSDEHFKEILEAERSHFIAYIEHADTLILSILTVLSNEQFDLLQSRLSVLIRTIEDLMKLIELISVRCDEHLKEIESEKQVAKRKALLHFGIAAAEIIYGISTYRPRGTVQRIIEGALFASNGFVLGCALAAKQQLTEAINRQSNTLKRLHELHATLTRMFNQGKFIMDLSGEEMSYQRETLIEEFVEFRIQYKQFADILNDD